MYDTENTMEQKKKSTKTSEKINPFKTFCEQLSQKVQKGYPENKVAVIIGASSGIGYETAIRLIGRNYLVVNLSRTSCRLEQVINYSADVTKQNELERGLKAIGDILKHIDVLVYSAGFSMAAPIEKAYDEDIRYLFEVNYFGALHSIRCVIPYMKDRGGNIILISSMGGILPIAFDCFYSCSKAALIMRAKSASGELKEFGIHTTAVLPGGTATPFTFKRKVYEDDLCGEYAIRLNQAVSSLADMEQNGMSPGEVAKEIVECLEDKNPPIVIHCGVVNKMYATAQRFLPDKTSLYLNNRKYYS